MLRAAGAPMRLRAVSRVARMRTTIVKRYGVINSR
jgi:hypothetical protein